MNPSKTCCKQKESNTLLFKRENELQK